MSIERGMQIPGGGGWDASWVEERMLEHGLFSYFLRRNCLRRRAEVEDEGVRRLRRRRRGGYRGRRKEGRGRGQIAT